MKRTWNRQRGEYDSYQRNDSNDFRRRRPRRTPFFSQSHCVEGQNKAFNRMSQSGSNTVRNRKSTVKQSENVQTPSTSNEDSQENKELDIPGFYYDKEKKRYFKIAPNHCPNAITRDVIKKREAEKKRQEDIKLYQGKKPAETHSLQKKTLKHNVTSFIFSYSAGCLNSGQLCNNILKSHVRHLKPVNSQCLTESLPSLGGYNKLEHTQMMLVNKSNNDLLCLWSLKDTWVQRLQLVKLSETRRFTESSPISVHGDPHGKVIIQSLNKVTDICWAPFVNDSQEDHVLYTTICHTGYLNSLAMIRSLSSEQEQEPIFIDYNLDDLKASEYPVVCLWVTVQAMTQCQKQFWSDVNAQHKSGQTGSCLHTGTRNGFVLTHDLRSRSTRPVCSLQHKSSVCSTNLLQNDVTILASDFTGRICLWDLRNKKAVVEYSGNSNQYTKIPVHVDERERIVYTVGEDGYTRFWCLRLGSLLHTIPPPCQTSRETIPCVQFSMRWGDKMGNIGLIMGLEDKLHYYGSLSAP